MRTAGENGQERSRTRRRSRDTRAPRHEPRLPLQEELEAIAWVQHEVRLRRPLPIAEAEAVAGSLYLRSLARAEHAPLPEVTMPEDGNFLASHAINVAVLSMTLAAFVQFDGDAVRTIGLAALLHDIGMARVPLQILTKPGQISQEERDAIKEHPQQGARVILEADASLDLAAIVAYEHHLKADGSGYPKLTYTRAPHYLSRLVQLCDIYQALRSTRPFRKPWPPDIIASYINERAGFEFHPTLATALTTMMGKITASAQTGGS